MRGPVAELAKLGVSLLAARKGRWTNDPRDVVAN